MAQFWSYVALSCGIVISATILSFAHRIITARRRPLTDNDLTHGMAFNRRAGRLEIRRRMNRRAFRSIFGGQE